MRTIIAALVTVALSHPAFAQDEEFQDEELPPVELEQWPKDGLRIGVGLEGAKMIGDLGSHAGFGFGGRGRIGYELVWDTFGLTIGGEVAYDNFLEKDLPAFGAFSLMPGARAQLHLGTIAPWAGFHFGMASVDGESGMGLSLGGGLDFMERVGTRVGGYFLFNFAGVERESLGEAPKVDSQQWLSFGLAATWI